MAAMPENTVTVSDLNGRPLIEVKFIEKEINLELSKQTSKFLLLSIREMQSSMEIIKNESEGDFPGTDYKATRISGRDVDPDHVNIMYVKKFAVSYKEEIQSGKIEIFFQLKLANKMRYVFKVGEERHIRGECAYHSKRIARPKDCLGDGVVLYKANNYQCQGEDKEEHDLPEAWLCKTCASESGSRYCPTHPLTGLGYKIDDTEWQSLQPVLLD